MITYNDINLSILFVVRNLLKTTLSLYFKTTKRFYFLFDPFQVSKIILFFKINNSTHTMHPEHKYQLKSSRIITELATHKPKVDILPVVMVSYFGVLFLCNFETDFNYTAIILLGPYKKTRRKFNPSFFSFLGLQ
jgi:hypothetical protein